VTTGVTLELFDYTGVVGKCEKGHVVKVGKNGYGFCVECSDEISGYCTLYVVPQRFQMPGMPE
tara:strand:+ start:1532 stop:1720 length:189 start_codon:yes stop_codon:yes gene_type:complete